LPSALKLLNDRGALYYDRQLDIRDTKNAATVCRQLKDSAKVANFFLDPCLVCRQRQDTE